MTSSLRPYLHAGHLGELASPGMNRQGLLYYYRCISLLGLPQKIPQMGRLKQQKYIVLQFWSLNQDQEFVPFCEV